MRFKHSVDSSDVRHMTWYAVGYAAAVADLLGIPAVTVTSMRDGRHGPNSRHYAGLAVDLRTRHLTPEQKAEWLATLRANLDPQGFDTVLESNHLHIEYDPKEGEPEFDARID